MKGREKQYEQQITKLEKENKLLYAEKNEEIRQLEDKIKKLEKQNKTMTEKLLKSAQDVGGHYEEESVVTQSEVGAKKSTANIYVSPTGARILTKKMMKDTIAEIYKSKESFDKKCVEAKMPKETMEQHMYTFLNQKYGLKVKN